MTAWTQCSPLAVSDTIAFSDHDPLYRFHRWQANLRVLEVTEIKTVPYVPLSHPFVERLIGTMRCESWIASYSGARPIWRQLLEFQQLLQCSSNARQL